MRAVFLRLHHGFTVSSITGVFQGGWRQTDRVEEECVNDHALNSYHVFSCAFLSQEESFRTIYFSSIAFKKGSCHTVRSSIDSSPV